MKHRIQSFIGALVLALGLSSAVLSPVGAINVFKNCPAGSVVCESAKTDSANTLTQNLIETLLIAIGIISVIMIIVGGIRYALSNGDANKIKQGKDTVLYAVIGLVVAMLAYAIVNFVVAQF